MKMKERNDLKQKSVGELRSLVSEVSRQIEKANLEIKSRKTKNSNAVKNLMKKMAMIKTLLREKEMENE